MVSAVGMTGKVWLRCFLVSFVIACLIPLFTSVILAPEEGEMVVDLAAIDPESIGRMSDEEFNTYMRQIPMRRIEGIKRFTYPFTHPQYFHFYARGVLSAFVWVFLATVVVSYLNHRNAAIRTE